MIEYYNVRKALQIKRERAIVAELTDLHANIHYKDTHIITCVGGV